jgi:hypothetical protein
MKKQVDQVYQFRITLQQTSPLIWRRIQTTFSGVVASRSMPEPETED